MPSREFIELCRDTTDPVIREVILDVLTFGLRYGFVSEALLVRADNCELPVDIIFDEIRRQYDEMPSKEFH